MIDIGANLTNKAFRNDLDDVLERARDAGLEHIVVTGTNLEESKQALDLCEKRDGLLSCTAGVHPHDAGEVTTDWLNQLETLHQHVQVKAVGEAGLDFNRNYSPPDSQRRVFRSQLELACRINKPVFVHDRDSQGDTLGILKDYDHDLSAVVIHCFTGSEQELTHYLDRGYYIGITGWVCDERRGLELQSLVPIIPDNRLLLETDAPWLLPRNLVDKPVKKNRCEPAHLSAVVKKVAQLRGQSERDVRQQTQKNATLFFSI